MNEPQSKHQRQILVADDNPATLYSTSRLLRAAGFEVIEARNGSEALQRVTPQTDLVVLDVNMPDMSGYDVCRELRSRPTTQRLPVLHLSATFVTEMDKVVALDAGSDGYLTHPVEPLVLVGTVNAFLRTRQAEEEVRRSEARFRAVFDQAPSGIAMVDPGLVYLDANVALCKMLGRERSEVVGRSMLEGRPEPDQLVEGIHQTVKERGQWRGVFPIQRADGSELHLEWQVSMHQDPGPEVTAGLCIVTAIDVTEQRELEAERERLLTSERAARSESERANRLKDDFLAMLSHELRNPLNAILGWAAALGRQHRTGDLSEGLKAIERNARVQAQLISDLLDVSSITSGKLRLDLEVVELVPVVETAIKVMAPAAEAKGVRIEARLDPLSGFVRGDGARLQQVVWNLLSNAVKFTSKGGWVRVELVRRGSELQLSVADNGRGIARDFLPHIFERFRQQDASTTKTYSGLGLGLAIVRDLVETHGGRVSVHSEGEGRGALFVVTLPAASIEGPSNREPSEDLEPLKGIKVLVVEDDADARALVCRLLEERGARVADAADVETALTLVESFHPQLLVSDIGMAGRDGYELIRKVRAMGHSESTLPAVALTAFARPEDKHQAILAGYQVHLPKPVEPQDLIQTVCTLLRRS
jgi:PAS domain S-box-containing protein